MRTSRRLALCVALASLSACPFQGVVRTDDAPAATVRVRDLSTLDYESLREVDTDDPGWDRWRASAASGDTSRAAAFERAHLHAIVMARVRSLGDPVGAEADARVGRALCGGDMLDPDCMERAPWNESALAMLAQAAWHDGPLPAELSPGDAVYADAITAALLAEALGARTLDGAPAALARWRTLRPDAPPLDDETEAWAEIEAALMRVRAGAQERGSADVLRAIEPARDALMAASVRVARPPSTLTDVTLQVARAFDEDALHRAPTPDRMVVVRSTGIELYARQSEVWRDGAVALEPEVARVDALRFDGPGMLPVDALEADRLPAFGEVVDAFEATLPEAMTGPTGVVADGSLYFTSLRPVLVELLRSGHSPRLLQRSATSDSWVGLPVDLVPETAQVRHALLVRADGFFFSSYDPDAMRELQPFARVEGDALVSLYGYLVEAFTDGRVDPSEPLTIVVEDPTVDLGILSHLVQALSWVRGEGASTDMALLRSPAQRGERGLPKPLFPAGLRLAF